MNQSIDEIVEKFKSHLIAKNKAEAFFKETIEPKVEKVFQEKFVKAFETIAEAINTKVGSDVIHCYHENKDKFVIEGLYHKIFFQKSQIEIIVAGTVQVNIIPIYAWKGITKHMGPISFILDIENNTVTWDISFDSIEMYATNLFSGFVEDKDFSL
ncbi:MAG: hypothetical protein AB1472_07515 [Candidatus Omnitrophota bacterium]